MPNPKKALTQGWKKTYEKHGVDIAVGFKGLVEESAASTKNCLKKYTS